MTFEQLRDMIVDTLGCDEEKITMDAKLGDDLGIDSLDAVDLVMNIEEDYGVKIPDEELGNLVKISDVLAAIEKYQA
ncbi:MAG: acyl carrier protein [Eubacteriaceae bacterium]|nr:acyl carrier protein [Eubacteriaceae bacterium]